MDYRYIAIFSMLTYSLVAPLLKVAMVEMPSPVAVLISNLIVLFIALAIAQYRGQRVIKYLRHPKTPHMLIVGTCIGISLLAFYRALALGPLSVVVPIYGLFIVTSTVIGIVFFDEVITAKKTLGVILAIFAIVLIAR
jgi:transporter family protein